VGLGGSPYLIFPGGQGLLQNILDDSVTGGSLDVVVQSQAAGATAASSSSFGLPALGLAAAGQIDSEGLLGEKFFGPRYEVDLIALGNDGGSIAGGWLRSSAIYESFYGEIGIEALTDLDGEEDVRISDLFVLNRQKHADIIAGRQRYLKGPVNNSGLGSLFSDLYFDGLSVDARTSEGDLTVAWFDRYEQWGSPPAERSGALGRFQATRDGGVFALNLLTDEDGWGWSVDGVVPLVPGEIDTYLELGQDTLNRSLVTGGVYFPGLYRSSDIDLFVEFADRENYQSMLSAYAYWEADEGWTGIGSIRALQERDDLEFTIGVARRIGSLSE
jgi:hypothetical protein